MHHSTGGHHAIRHPSDPAIRVTVVRHTKGLKRATPRAIIRQAGPTQHRLLDLL